MEDMLRNAAIRATATEDPRLQRTALHKHRPRRSLSMWDGRAKAAGGAVRHCPHDLAALAWQVGYSQNTLFVRSGFQGTNEHS